MIEVANAGINTFGITSPKANVSPSEEPIFVLSSSQLQEIISRAIQPLQDEVQSLKDTIASLESKVSALTTTQEQEVNRLAVDIAFDRQRIAKLEHALGPANEARIEKLKDYLTAKKDAGLRPEASFTEARAYLEVSRSQFSQLISKLDPRDFVISAHPLNYKAKMIGLARKM